MRTMTDGAESAPMFARIYLAGVIDDLDYGAAVDALHTAGIVVDLGNVRAASEDPVADVEALLAADLVVQAGAEEDEVATLTAWGAGIPVVGLEDVAAVA